MKSTLLFCLSIFTLLTSCSGQSITGIAGDTVSELGNNLMVVYQDTKNNYWFASWEDGVYMYAPSVSLNTGSETIIHFTTKHGLSHNRVDDIQEDKSGNIYFNTSSGGGITKFDGKSFTILKATTGAGSEWRLNPDDLWFRNAQFTDYVYRYDGKLLYKQQLPKHPNYSKPYEVYCIYKDSKGNIWFGTNPLGVFLYNGKSFDWISEEDVTELHNGPANGVRSIIEDKNGYFWFNTMYRYKVYEKTDGRQKFYTKEKSIGSLDGKTNGTLNEYLSIAKDNNNELWFATYRNGIWRYNGKNIIHYPVKDGVKDITLFSIYKDQKGNLWLGTHETGVYKFNGQTFERFRP
jgi:ligand-binding sensor domain-containing protein